MVQERARKSLEVRDPDKATWILGLMAHGKDYASSDLKNKKTFKEDN